MLKQVLRVGTVVAVEGCGSLLSGKYLVWSVRHTITTQAHAMSFVLVRNAMGPAPSGGGGGLNGGTVSYYELLLDSAAQHRFYGKYRGIVTDVDADDAADQGHRAGGAGRPRRAAGACRACPTPAPSVGFFFLPEVGAAVWIEFEGGDVSYPIWSGLLLARRRAAGRRRVRRSAASSPPRRTSCSSTTTPAR